MSRKVKWGIIGAGNISGAFANALNGLDNVIIQGVASRALDKAEAFAKQFGVVKAYGSYEELVKDEDIDVIYIGTPHSEHLNNGLLCLNGKKAVLCEKPFTINSKETQLLIDAAKENDVFLMEAMWTKFLPVTKKVKEWIETGRIGDIRMIKANLGFRATIDPKNRLFDKTLGGGALLDVGVYVLTYANHIMDAIPVEQSALATFGSTGVDEQVAFNLQYSGGALASLTCAITADTGIDARIMGSKGEIIIKNFHYAEEAILRADGQEELFYQKHLINGYEYEAMEVNECILNNKKESNIVPLKDTQDIMNMMDTFRATWGYEYPMEV